MSLPSDVTEDVTEAAERMELPRDQRRRLTLEQKGWMAAALVAFVGIVYGGPALARLRAQPTLRQRANSNLEDARRRLRKSGHKARKRLRRLGGGSIWR